MISNGVSKDENVKSLGPSFYARVSELEEVNGTGYEIELLAQDRGYLGYPTLRWLF